MSDEFVHGCWRSLVTRAIGGGDTTSQRLIEIKILTRAAAANFAAGEYDSFDQSLPAIDTAIGTVCGASSIAGQCSLRKAIVPNLRAERALWDVTQS